MEYFELVGTLFLAAGFLLAMSRDRVTWMTVDLMISVVMGFAWVFAPQFLLDFETDGELNGVHLLFGRLFGIAMLCGALKLYLNYRSQDSYAQVMLLASRIVTSTIVLMVLLHVFYGDLVLGKVEKAPPKLKAGEKPPPPSKDVVFNKEWRSMGLTGAIGALLGNTVWFLKSRHYGGHTSLDSMLNMHLRFDFFITLIIAVMHIGFTPTILGFTLGVTSPDTVLVHLGQCFGGLLIGDAILSAVAPGFLFEEDKRNILLGRVGMVVVSVIVSIYTIVFATGYEQKQLLFSIVIDSLWIGNAYLGYKFAPHETANYRSPPHKTRQKSKEDE